MMVELIDVVKLINASKFRTRGQLDSLIESGTQMRMLYDLLAQNQQVRTDDDVRRALPELASPPSKLYTIKSKLMDRLINALLLLDFREAELLDRQTAYIECSKKWAASMVLHSKNLRSAYILYLEALLKQTKRFEFTEITVEVLRALRLFNSIITGDRATFEHYHNELKIYEKVYQQESHAEELYARMMITFINTRSDKKAMSETAAEYFEITRHYLAESTSFKVQLFGRLIQLAIYDNLNDFAKAAELCAAAIDFFDQKSYKSSNVQQIFYYSLFMSVLNLRDYERCIALIEGHHELFDDGRFNWYKVMELYFLAQMHAGKYQAAEQTLHRVMANPSFGTHSPIVIETWKIFEGYLQLLKALRQLPEQPSDSRFKLNKFMNDIQFYAKDKSGMNIPVVLLPYLFALTTGDQAQCIDREPALAKYRTRYLSPEGAARSHYFFRMLETLPKAQFRPAEVERRCEAYLQELRRSPLQAANQNYEVEVIPYEALWEILLGFLSQQEKRGQKQVVD